MTQLRDKPKRELKPSSLTLTPQLRDLYKIVNDKSASHEEREQALAKINEISGYEDYESNPKVWKIPKKCEICGIEYLPKRRKQKTCGKTECQNKLTVRKREKYEVETYEKGKVWTLDENTWKWRLKRNAI